MINTVVFIPMAIALLQSRFILDALGQDPAVVAYAQKYINVNLVSVYFYGMYDLQKRFLNCLNITWVPMIVQVCASFLHIFWCYFFVEV